jgi:peroxiredoxin
MRVFSFPVFLLLLMFSCSGEKSNFSIEVRVSDGHGEMIYLAQRTLTGTFPVDSVLPDKSGKYMIKGFTKQPDFYILYRHPRNFINLIIHPGDDFKVLTTANAFDRDYLIEGSKDSRLIQKMVNMQTRTLEKITGISERYENSKGQPNFATVKTEVDSAYDNIFAEHKKFSIALIEENPGSLAGLMSLYQQLGRNAPVFDYKKDFHYYELVDSNLSILYPNSEAVIDLNRKVTQLRELKKLEVGSPAPEIVLPDSTGQTISLSSLKGKITLIVFWASWSTQSMEEMKQFADIYAKTSDLNLYQVSIDRTRESWLRNITGRNARGIHVSDLKYWDSPVIDLYHIEKLPVTYLLDKEGVILQKNFSSGELTELLGKIR